MSSVGILGGTFNPIHLGHLRAAEEVRDVEQLDEMWFVPAALPPHKEGLLASEHRLRMVELAVAGVPGFRVSPPELYRPGPTCPRPPPPRAPARTPAIEPTTTPPAANAPSTTPASGQVALRSGVQRSSTGSGFRNAM